MLRARVSEEQQLQELRALRGPRGGMRLLQAMRTPLLRRLEEQLEGEVVVLRLGHCHCWYCCRWYCWYWYWYCWCWYCCRCRCRRRARLLQREPQLRAVELREQLLALLQRGPHPRAVELRLAANRLAAGETKVHARCRRTAKEATSPCTESPHRRAP